MKTDWDYSERAHTYDQRADYSADAIQDLLANTGCSKDKPVADIGAGTGKLTKILLDKGLTVKAVEPNDNMRGYGILNTHGKSVKWSEGVGEDTGLNESSVYAAFFGSSFNVVDPQKALAEVARILVPGGWFACMWNHRDTEDETQKAIENIIFSHLPDYSYGARRQDPTPLIEASGLFGEVYSIEKRFNVLMTATQIVEAWRSHDTLFRQSGEKFEQIISDIANLLSSSEYSVPYFTRIWYSRLAIDKSDLASELYKLTL